MFRGGLLEEVTELLTKFPRQAHAFKAIGYRQAIDHLDGKIALQQAIEETQIESRHYAKRQRTWFHSDPNIIWLDGQLDMSEIRERASALLESWLGKKRGQSP
jgi:tRNA dimethylallyltransferase